MWEKKGATMLSALLQSVDSGLLFPDLASALNFVS